MKTKLCLVGLLVSILTGCSNDDILSINDNPTEGKLCEIAVSQNVKAITNYISKHHGSISRSAEKVIYPYIVAGDTVMYIANYGDGWEVFSNDPRTPMLLMKCDEGDFYPTALNTESPFENLFQNTAEYLNSLKKTDFAPTDTINSEWLAYGIEPMSFSDVEKDPEDPEDEYYWKYVASSPDIESHSEYMPQGGRLATKWHQNRYFALFTPFKGGNHTPVGCTALALGQYLYFTHYKDNRPEKTVTNAIYNQAKNTYTFSGSSSIVWDSFVKYHISDSTTMAPTATFLGWIAQKIDTQFDVEGSSAGFSKALSFFNDQTQLKASIISYLKNSALEVLEKGYPVLIRASTDNDEGHVWLIDYYECDSRVWDDYYIYIKKTHGPYTEDEEDFEGDALENPTVKNIREIFGDVPVEIRTQVIEKPYFKCNWGFGGTDDNIKIDARVLPWTADGNTFTKEVRIFYFK